LDGLDGGEVSKKKLRPRSRKPGAYTDYEDASRELRAHGPRARWALDELERLAKGETEYGKLPPALTILCLKEILAYEGLPKALQFKAAEGVSGDTTITIQVANWAAASPMPRALPEPETIIEASAPRTNGTPPAPTMSNRERLRRQVAAQRETVIVEAPVSPSEPAHVVGRVQQGRPYEMSEDEKQRAMEILGGVRNENQVSLHGLQTDYRRTR
jgi:hypothetical protein